MGTQKAVPHLWSYKGDIEPILLRAAELVTMDDSERRSLILVNPGLRRGARPSATMYTAYRLNDANEVMPPHRHSPNADPLRADRQGQFHRRRRRGHHLRAGRHGAHAGRHLAQPRQCRERAGDQSLRCSTCRWSRRSTRSISSTTTPRWSTASRSKKKQQTATVPTDYSARAYDHGGLQAALPRASTAAPASPRRCTSIAGR